MSRNADPSLAGLTATMARHLRALLMGEASLARAEIATGLRGMMIALVLIVVGVLLVLTALDTAAAAAVLALQDQGLTPGQAALAVTGGALLLAALLIWRGLAGLKLKHLKPEKAMRNLRRDASLLKEMTRHDTTG
ncbi:phage holin family protein [Actibacterium ureilyticum]|uniref:phage holin family protein n=1 Tax=Actibacterium ureilyticum TaxID=1590614 RepID=UPI000BAA99C9|nr:phage holin family protein [Actibacterium ureilyticum]